MADEAEQKRREQEEFDARVLASDRPNDVVAWADLWATCSRTNFRPLSLGPGMESIADAFHMSMVRLADLVHMSDYIWADAAYEQKLYCVAAFEETGHPYPDLGDNRPVLRRIWEKQRAWLDDHARVPDHLKRSIASGTAFLESRRGDIHKTACRAILESVIIGCYSAFEIIAGDLWVKMVDQRPKSAMRSFLKTEGKNQEKSIDISVTLEFDLKTQMGTMLREQEKAKFDALSKAKREYERAFGTSAGGPFDRDHLVAIEAARNVMAHRGGIMDVKFQKDIGPKKHPFGELTIGAPLRLNGRIVALLVTSILEATDDLGNFASNWLSSHAD